MGRSEVDLRPADAPEFIRVWRGWGLIHMTEIHMTDKEWHKLIEVCPERHIDRVSLDTTLNEPDMRNEFGYTMLCAIDRQEVNKNGNIR